MPSHFVTSVSCVCVVSFETTASVPVSCVTLCHSMSVSNYVALFILSYYLMVYALLCGCAGQLCVWLCGCVALQLCGCVVAVWLCSCAGVLGAAALLAADALLVLGVLLDGATALPEAAERGVLRRGVRVCRRRLGQGQRQRQRRVLHQGRCELADLSAA
jgi:hypothetical protein